MTREVVATENFSNTSRQNEIFMNSMDNENQISMK